MKEKYRPSVDILMIGLHLLTVILIIICFTLFRNYMTTKDQLADITIKLEGFIDEQAEQNEATESMLVNTNYYLGKFIEEKDSYRERPVSGSVIREIDIEYSQEEKDLLQSMVSVYAGTELGSGFVVSAYGHVLTSYEVVKDYARIEVDFFDGQVAIAKQVKTFPEKNLAIIRVIGRRMPYLAFGNSDTISESQTIRVLHHPLGYGITIDSGTITGLNTDGFQFDADTNKGSLGGPIIDDTNSVIGVVIGDNSALYSNDINPLLADII